MNLTSRDTPCFYFTSVAKDRFPVFRSNAIKQITCAALDEARTSGGFLTFAYVIMPDHLHFITDSTQKPSEVLRFSNGIISRRVIDYLKAGNFASSLEKLRDAEKRRGYKYSLWDHHNNTFPIYSESVFMRRVHYIHQNPVRAGIVERSEEYQWSSIHSWNRQATRHGPLPVDISKLEWRRGIASKI